MAASCPDPPASTFVLRFWLEWSAAGPRWRGRIDHVQSGQRAGFRDLDEMVKVVRSFGVMDGGQSLPEEGNA
jgi:hypothetical protein